MQPEIINRLPEGDEWQYEVKWDGYRAIVVKSGHAVTIYSRRRNNLTARYSDCESGTFNSDLGSVLHEISPTRPSR